MIIHNFPQGSPLWHAARLGIPTSSEMDQIVTPAGKPSASAVKYMARLLGERLLGYSLAKSLEHIEAVQRGKLLEPDAANMFGLEYDLETRPVGFVTTDSGRWGASPDRLIHGGGLLEIKCPEPQTHMLYEIDGFGSAYFVQAQGQLLVCEQEVCWRYSYCPPFPPVTHKTYRDEPFIKKLHDALQAFSDDLDKHTERMRAGGYYAPPAAMDGSLHDYTVTGEGELPNNMMAG